MIIVPPTDPFSTVLLVGFLLGLFARRSVVRELITRRTTKTTRRR